jgi:hypothetical protein
VSQAFSVAQDSQQRAGITPLSDVPGDWVPFRAVRTDVFNPEQVLVSRIYRSRDGSTRTESGASLDNVDTITIKNMTEKTFYKWVKDGGWTSHPMQLPGGRYVPPTTTAPQGAEDAGEVEGLGVLKMRTDRGGSTQYLSPQLSYYPVKATVPCKDASATGCGWWLSNIVVGEQPPELFRPPSGEAVVKSDRPAGIVSGRASGSAGDGSSCSAVQPGNKEAGRLR